MNQCLAVRYGWSSTEDQGGGDLIDTKKMPSGWNGIASAICAAGKGRRVCE